MKAWFAPVALTVFALLVSPLMATNGGILKLEKFNAKLDEHLEEAKKKAEENNFSTKNLRGDERDKTLEELKKTKEYEGLTQSDDFKEGMMTFERYKKDGIFDAKKAEFLKGLTPEQKQQFQDAYDLILLINDKGLQPEHKKEIEDRQAKIYADFAQPENAKKAAEQVFFFFADIDIYLTSIENEYKTLNKKEQQRADGFLLEMDKRLPDLAKSYQTFMNDMAAKNKAKKNQ